MSDPPLGKKNHKCISWWDYGRVLRKYYFRYRLIPWDTTLYSLYHKISSSPRRERLFAVSPGIWEKRFYERNKWRRFISSYLSRTERCSERKLFEDCHVNK